jgi:hypothetical protein
MDTPRLLPIFPSIPRKRVGALPGLVAYSNGKNAGFVKAETEENRIVHRTGRNVGGRVSCL